MWGTGAFASSAMIRLNEDGSVSISYGSPEVGSGANTVLSQIVAEHFKLSVGQVTLSCADTEFTPYDLASGSSRITYTLGLAFGRASNQIQSRMLRIASEMLEVAPDDLEFVNQAVAVRGLPERRVSYAQIAQHAHATTGGPLVAVESFRPETPDWDREHVRGHPMPAKAAESFNTHYCEVLVDTRTGKVAVTRYVAAHDVGRAINPAGVESQIQGGVIHGLGWALMEEMITERGQVINPSFFEYRVPLAPEVPKVEPVIVEEPIDDGPFGAKGVGETGCFPVGAAIANAIYDAVGVRLTEVPLSAERVLHALGTTAGER
jgi:xanthine dehydrogenase molybdenum-binding subunit